VKYLLDTNVLIACLRGNQAVIHAVISKGQGHDLAISSVTYAELMVGLLKKPTPRRRAALNKVLAPLPVLPFEKTAASAFARVKADLEAIGSVIGPYDMQIAGHAIASRRRLVTHNTKEFSRIASLSYEDWER